ncbi:hypothetical protein M427DRAFT_58622 [Gonapodya prolifera JEL478]|uniref:Histone acetyltransferases subunit 3-domain-containing protein n=1 Tax=Gonapodya prolifera (strain JEL478) TaxID=1344416 RepID=A0A139A9M3_GONPJ|nr:hypothetical protein M427DRAFT_58622 [Gonapodya prolifera JEL478]|eukprot:KXS13368.1 hypothetical protein M427DRAFT_58622 [Gonapodya prolifera JEL478]
MDSPSPLPAPARMEWPFDLTQIEPVTSTQGDLLNYLLQTLSSEDINEVQRTTGYIPITGELSRLHNDLEAAAQRKREVIEAYKLRIPELEAAAEGRPRPPRPAPAPMLQRPKPLPDYASLGDPHKRKRDESAETGSLGRRSSPPPTSHSQGSKPPAAPKPKQTKPRPTAPKPKSKAHAGASDTRGPGADAPGPGEEGFDGDYSRVTKPQNQTPTDAFWRFADQYLRSITEEDMAWLMSKGEDRTLYMIPPLGRPYRAQWEEQDRQLRIGAGLPHSSSIPPPLGPPAQTLDIRPHLTHTPRDQEKVKEYGEDVDKDIVVGGDMYLGHFTERVVAGLLHENVLTFVEDAGGEQREEVEKIAKGVEARTRADLVGLEETLKRELRDIGLLGDDDVDWSTTEDDDVSVQLRILQRKLRDKIDANHARKLRVLEVARRWKAYQEYREVVEHIERQLEAVYVRRFRSIKKKKPPVPNAPPTRPNFRPGQTDPDHVAELIAKRRKFVKDLGDKMFPRREFGGEPKTTSIFDDEERAVLKEEGPVPQVGAAVGGGVGGTGVGGGAGAGIGVGAAGAVQPVPV